MRMSRSFSHGSPHDEVSPFLVCAGDVAVELRPAADVVEPYLEEGSVGVDLLRLDSRVRESHAVDGGVAGLCEGRSVRSLPDLAFALDAWGLDRVALFECEEANEGVGAAKAPAATRVLEEDLPDAHPRVLGEDFFPLRMWGVPHLRSVPARDGLAGLRDQGRIGVDALDGETCECERAVVALGLCFRASTARALVSGVVLVPVHPLSRSVFVPVLCGAPQSAPVASTSRMTVRTVSGLGSGLVSRSATKTLVPQASGPLDCHT